MNFRDGGEGAAAGERRRRLVATWRLMGEEAGQSFVELALIMPIFALLIWGCAAFGQLAYYAIEVSNAASAGAEYGAHSPINAANTAQIQAAAANDALDLSSQNPNPLVVTATQTYACSDTPLTQSSAQPICTGAGNHVVAYVQVNTSATITPMFLYPGLSPNFTLSGFSIMRVQVQ